MVLCQNVIEYSITLKIGKYNAGVTRRKTRSRTRRRHT